ncbi:MAG: competence/damage-inducible protein A [Bacillota bacterium]
MKCEIISVGTEILLGDILDTNSNYVAKEMQKLGIDVFFISTVGDNLQRLKNTVLSACQRSDLIIITGGLGPTDDDLTKEAVCSVLNIPLCENQEEVAKLNYFFQSRGMVMPSNNLRQVFLPANAIVLENKIGTASGIIINKDQKNFIMLPGPPSEMRHIFNLHVIPWLKGNIAADGGYLYSHTLKFIGISESQLELDLKGIIDKQTNPTLALLAKNGEIHLRLTAKAGNQDEFNKLVYQTEKEVLARVGKYYYGSDEEKLEELVGKLLLNHKLTLATAESCTGGLIGTRLTDIPGSSAYFLGSIVAYDNSIKEKLLRVNKDILAVDGAVSEKTAVAMAEGARMEMGSDLALATTGIAGPQGGTDDKPVGLVFIALVGKDICICKKHVFSGNRTDVRWRSSTWALNLLKRSLEKT